LGDEATTTVFASRLRDLGVLVTPVLFPAVPLGAARLRLCVTAAHTSHDLEFALDAFRRLQEILNPRIYLRQDGARA
jgi:glycine C-acetyltransferase